MAHGAGIIGRLRDIPVAAKLTALVVVGALSLGYVGASRISAIRPNEMAARQAKVHNLVEVALGVVGDFEARARSGELGTEQAKREALGARRAARDAVQRQ